MKRALISVYDKTGILELAQKLTDLGWEIISTGGTAATLKKSGIYVVDIDSITGFPECFDGRVKTLHPKIHGGLLALRNNAEHQSSMKELGIQPIDLVVNNLYPFKATVLKPGVTHEEIIENIDIGGPSMLRAAAKNYHDVTVVTDPTDYPKILAEIEQQGNTTLKTRQALAAKVFQHTSHYDTLIANYFNKQQGWTFPDTLSQTFEKKQDLRYGENPHQQAAFYSDIDDTAGTLAEAIQLHGKELSYNNIGDTNGALETLKEFSEPTVVAVKHANPCGVASAKSIEKAYDMAYESDKISIFGGIVAANREIDAPTARKIADIFIEVLVAPGYTQEALEILTKKKNIRILQLSNIEKADYQTLNYKKVLGGMLVQQLDQSLLIEDKLKVVTDRPPNEQEMKDLRFAWKVVKHLKSNAIALAKDLSTVALGPGQVSRIWALENAIRQGGDAVRGSVMASDAFFPFSDSVEAAAKAGIRAIIQPGGSIRDKDSINAANRYNIAMVFTEMRHFKH